MKVGIYYPFEPYVGGGERYTYAIAEHMSRNNQVQLLTQGHERVLALSQSLGYDLSRVTMLPRTGYIPGLERALGSKRYDLFVCISNHAVPPVASLGKSGLLIVQFPFAVRAGDWKARLLGPLMLRSYRLTIVYSNFVAEWLCRRSAGRIPVQVLPPPVDMVPADPDTARERVILCVGRFFQGQHNKRHDHLVRVFRELVDAGMRGWELHIAGATRPEEEHQAYLAHVRALAEGYPVTIHADIPQDALLSLYRRASVFWHATGHGTDELEHPEAMEHFGMVTVEAMANGCVPMVVARGGQPEIVQHGLNGFLWGTLDELKGCMLEYIALDKTAQRCYRAAAIETSKQYSLDEFHSRLDRLVAAW